MEDSNHNDYNVLVLYLLGELSPDEERTVEEWIRESEVNEKTYASVKKVWEATGEVQPAPVAVDVDSAWTKMQQRMGAETAQPEPDFATASPDPDFRTAPSKTNIRRLLPYLAAAAVITLAVMTFVLTDWFKKEIQPSIIRVEALAEVMKDTLDDGSSVIINQHSSLAIAEMTTASERNVELSGEAFFAVTPDTAKPFVVKTALGSIRVHGTKFNVKAYSGSDLEVTVEEGLVSVIKLDEDGAVIEELYLHPGDKGILSAETGELYKAEKIAPDELYWANRKLIFQETELSQVFAILSNYYSFDYMVDNGAILNCTLTASFTNQDLEHMLEIIAATFELEFSWEDSVYYFKGEGCLHD